MVGKSFHESVLRKEAVSALAVKPDGIYIDATFGRGGHSRAILEQLGSGGRLIAIDRDPDAIEEAFKLQRQDPRLEVAHATFSQLEDLVESKDIHEQVDGILFDLGVSSPQLDTAERGFSFMRDGPLDMRMNPTKGFSAAMWLNYAKENDIADVLYKFGEERHSRRIARSIVATRETRLILTTNQLAEIAKQANPSWEKDKHPATRTFQAVRIYINKEFDEIEHGLTSSLSFLRKSGRQVVISFHSLEDRIVKKFIAKQTKGDNFPRDLPVTSSMLNPRLKPICKRIKASADEIENNPRARSAVMRVAEKIA
ncbi:MAG TPA: 16S rRNA (cytosine(1402)-N(4))-methyltransferase RsmH [Gammaproteobacteria bacterium]|jgi:16S rRNA (cytosine1402-N4)-methyltransferase|nr:16S rRNA (cytosine(1402)-N(4))-methyltransferase RsmH [Gammaproteobacteria bacterium]|tara:strand:- start:23705 stop:24640 length:936 start_codon:yes stop_codon:yes gene_type:complete